MIKIISKAGKVFFLAHLRKSSYENIRGSQVEGAGALNVSSLDKGRVDPAWGGVSDFSIREKLKIRSSTKSWKC